MGGLRIDKAGLEVEVKAGPKIEVGLEFDVVDASPSVDVGAVKTAGADIKAAVGADVGADDVKTTGADAEATVRAEEVVLDMVNTGLCVVTMMCLCQTGVSVALTDSISCALNFPFKFVSFVMISWRD